MPYGFPQKISTLRYAQVVFFGKTLTPWLAPIIYLIKQKNCIFKTVNLQDK